MSQPKEIFTIEVISTHYLPSIPSASGIVKSGEHYYIIGDNSPYLFKLNREFEIISKTPIYTTNELVGSTIPKKIKPDFEAMEMVSKEEIVVFGSGSLSPTRDLCLRIFIGETLTVKSYNIGSFYTSLKKMIDREDTELNIEAIAFQNNELHFFNRGTNAIFSFDYFDLTQHFEGLIPFPTPKTRHFKLPKIKGIEARFSGATAYKNRPYLLFTASVEDTSNAYDDGEVLGSFIGIISLEPGDSSAPLNCTRIPDQKPPVKVESVTIDDEISTKESTIVLVTDSDGGDSTLLKCLLKL